MKNPIMIITCETCKNEFDKTDYHIKKSKHNFCSRKCANETNNKVYRWKGHTPLYKQTHNCKNCSKILKWWNSNGLCQQCLTKSLIEKSKSITLGELKQKHNKKNGRWYSAEIRSFNKSWNYELSKQPCQICGYSLHSELCHIKAIKDFDDNTTLGEINDSKNLKVLCPNHHWEFDNEHSVKTQTQLA